MSDTIEAADALAGIGWTEVARSERHASMQPNEQTNIVTFPIDFESKHLFRMLALGDRGDFSFQKSLTTDIAKRRKFAQQRLVAGTIFESVVIVFGVAALVSKSALLEAAILLVFGSTILALGWHYLNGGRLFRILRRRKLMALTSRGQV